MKKITFTLLMLVCLLALVGCGHEHQYTEKKVDATCTEKGYTEHTCECGDKYTDNEVDPAHKEEVVPGKEATCLEDGLTEGKKCSVCNEVLVAQTPILSEGHKYGEWKVVKEATYEEVGSKEKECSVCKDKVTEEIPVLDNPNASEYTVTYDLDGGRFVGGYTSTDVIGEEFLADFNKYGDGTAVSKENFQSDSHPCVLTSLSNSEMLTKWNWLWVYMLAHLKEFNEGKTSEYITDTYPVLEKMIKGDVTAIKDSANARTSIRSYLHGLLNGMKGCGDVNATFAAFSPDFSSAEVREEFLKHQYNLTETLANGATLPSPVRDGYTFKGWEDKNGNIVTTCKANGTHKAIWEENNPVTKIEITNKVDKINLYENYQLEWTIAPGDAGDQRVKFKSSDETIATIDELGFITTHKVGTVTFTIISLSKYGHTDTMTVTVVTPGFFDISYETVSYVNVGSSIKLNAQYIDSQNKVNAVEWSSLDNTAATVDAEGYVTGLKVGTVVIRATVKGNAEIYQDFVVTVLDEELNEALNVILNAHESNIFTKYDLPIGAGTPNYYSDIFGSISQLLFNHELEIDTTYNKKTNEKYGDDLESRVMESIEFVTVHYTAGFNAGADGAAHGEWFSQPLSSNNTSIHYSTGNDGVFKGLDEQYRAAHAGDDGSKEFVEKFSWIDTPVEVLDTDPKFPVVTITSNATFAINGRDTGVKVPEETKNGRGFVTDSKWLNDQGIAVNQKDGKYQIGTAWWCYTQISEGRICSNGGNKNSIGIESAVNKGSDLWYTWQITAQLVADIMLRHNLDITRVKGHHFFSAKDCPQPMLENDMEIWWKFIDLVESEYDKMTTLKDYEISFECDSDLINEKGRVVEQAFTSQVITYKVTLTKDGKTQTIELASILEGAYNRK